MSNENKTQKQLAKRVQMSRYIVSVDGQLKSSFDNKEAADKEAQRILSGFPILTVVVVDSDLDSIKILQASEPPAQKDDEAEAEAEE